MKSIFRITAVIILLLVVACAGIAQHVPVKFEQLPAEIGLAQGPVNCFVQDSRGVLWLGIWSGLVCYDGYRTRVFEQAIGKPNSLQSDQICSILEDRNRQLWIGTLNAGLHRFNHDTEQFVNFKNDPNDPNSLSNNDVWGLFEDKKGYIWVGTENGLNRFDPQTNAFLRIAAPDTGIPRPTSDYIYSICETSDGSIWWTSPQGLQRVKFSSERDYQLYHYSLAPDGKTGSLDDFIYRVRPAKREPNMLWVSTKVGLKKIRYSDADPAFLQVVHAYRNIPGVPTSLSHNIVPDFLELDDGNLWVATYHGLNLLDIKTGQFQRYFTQAGEPYTLSANLIRCLFQDRTGNLWVSTEKGLNKLNLRCKPFQGVRLDKSGAAANSNIMGLCNGGKPGSLWVAATGGLNRIDYDAVQPRTSYYALAPAHLADFANFPTSVWRDADGWLWLTTQGAGVLRIRERDIPPNGGRLTQLEQFSQSGPTVIRDNYIMSLLEYGDEGVWFGLWDGGLEFFHKKTGSVTNFQQAGDLSLTAFPNVAFLKKKEGEQMKLFVGTRGNGLLKCALDPTGTALQLERHYHFTSGQKGCLSNDKVNALLVDSQGRIWVCTSKGLNLLQADGTNFRTFTRADGLPNNIVQSIVEDRSGHFWVSTQNGIASLTLLPDGQSQIRSFDALDGLEDNFFMNSCATALPSSVLAFGGVSGVSLFAPDAIQMDTVPPLTLISDFLLFNRSVPIGPMENGRIILEKNIAETPEIVLNYRENVLSFEFVSLHFAEPRKNRFAHKLEGFDQDWVYTNADKRFAHYTNLPYKTYTFWVKSANGDGVWGEPVSIKVTVQPPFWLTWWAKSLYLLLVAALLYSGWRIAHLRAEYRANLALERMQRDQLETVNHLKFQFFTNISHELRTPLTLILTPLEQLIKEFSGDKKLHQLYTIMHHNAARLHTMINQLLDLRKGEEGMMQLRVSEADYVQFIREITLSFKSWADQRRIELDFEPTVISQMAWFDHEQMEKVIYNLLANALKYTPAGGRVQVQVNATEGSVNCTVSDTGPGIPNADTQRIFERFYQVKQVKTDTAERGAGIGLSLVKILVERHHGTVTLQSKEGVGSRFTVAIPLGKQHFKMAEFAAPEAVSPPYPWHYRMPTDLVQPDFTPVIVPATTAKASSPKHRILVVEDNADIALYLLQNLSAEFVVATATNGVEALRQALAHPPDIVLSDLAMPEMDGLELCRQLKTNVFTSHIPVVLLTARTSLIFKIDGLETGADDYITKPFNLQLLTIRLRNLIVSRQKLREKFSRNIELNPSEVSGNSLDETFLRNILASIEQHLDDSEYSVDQLAHDLHMSRVQLYRKIKAITGDVPNALIRSVRLKKAAQLLATRQYNVSEVAYKVGFTDLKYFRERFREQFGVNPGEYAS